MVQSFCIEYMHIDMYVIKHHNTFQSDKPSHIREMAKESYLNIFAKRRLRADADAWVIALALWDLSPGKLKMGRLHLFSYINFITKDLL